jgi:hypothetical protein
MYTKEEDRVDHRSYKQIIDNILNKKKFYAENYKKLEGSLSQAKFENNNSTASRML